MSDEVNQAVNEFLMQNAQVLSQARGNELQQLSKLTNDYSQRLITQGEFLENINRGGLGNLRASNRDFNERALNLQDKLEKIEEKHRSDGGCCNGNSFSANVKGPFK